MHREDLFSLDGRVALVTGGSRGIGAMVAEGFAANGARVYISARTEADLTATAGRLADLPGEVVPIVGDVGTVEGIELIAERVSTAEDGLHVLVNNAALQTRNAVDAFTEPDWDRVVDVNLKAAFFLTKSVLPLLRAGAAEDFRAKVINMSSITAEKTGAASDYSYRAAKAGLNQLTRMLGKDLARDLINVNAIAPGFFRSAMTEFMFSDEQLYERFRRTNPIPREGRAHEIAGLAVFLASRAGDYVTGSIIEIDGGLRFVN